MLLNNFFQLHNLDACFPDIKAQLVINPSHPIFSGHFPGQPVVPGVCMMQMVKEIIETVTGKRTNLTNAQEMKFLALINPEKNNIIDAVLKYSIQDHGQLQLSATLHKGELIHFKFKGLFDFL